MRDSFGVDSDEKLTAAVQEALGEKEELAQLAELCSVESTLHGIGDDLADHYADHSESGWATEEVIERYLYRLRSFSDDGERCYVMKMNVKNEAVNRWLRRKENSRKSESNLIYQLPFYISHLPG
jgi:hypothetical protein